MTILNLQSIAARALLLIPVCVGCWYAGAMRSHEWLSIACGWAVVADLLLSMAMVPDDDDDDDEWEQGEGDA